MAMPATRSLQKRYTAGSCVLDVEWQLSALSQWHPKPIAQDLRFKLWMNSTQGDAPAAGSALVAEGDRAALQEIAQYISQKVQGLLVIAHINSAGRSAALQSAPQPRGFQLTRSLSYLQLCDLNSVLHQCEQATAALPTTLSTASSVEPDASQANNVIPFTALRRSIRRRPTAWASSAAAALLAVGLTTALWPSYQRPSYRTSSEPNTEDSFGATPNAANKANPDSAVNLPSSVSPSSSPYPIASSGPVKNSNLEAKQPNTNTAATAERSQNAAVSQAQPQNKPATESVAKPQAKAPAAPPETATSPSAPASASSNAPPETPSDRAQEFSAADSSGTRAPGSALEAAPPSAARNSRDLRASPRTNTANSDAASTATDAAIAPSTADQAPVARAASQSEITTIAQVQRYFQTKWQEINVSLSEPLSYNLLLSEKGEVVSFTALSSAAAAYSDRLLPEDRPLVFSAHSPADSSATQGDAGFTLRLDILPNGQVQVSKI